MRGSMLTALALMIIMGGLVLPTGVAADARRDLPGYGQSREDPVHRPGDGRYDGGWRVREDRLGKALAWRDYQMHMQKHYRIMEKYGGGTPLPGYFPTNRAQPRYDFHNRQDRPAIRGWRRR